jgi:hypothetical protein
MIEFKIGVIRGGIESLLEMAKGAIFCSNMAYGGEQKIQVTNGCCS